MGLPLTGPVSGDEYVRDILVARLEAWYDERPQMRNRGYPPLLEWFIQDADVPYVQLPTQTPKPRKSPRPRQYRSAASLRAERDGVEQRMRAVAGVDEAGDGAIVNLSPHSRSRAARVAGRRRFAKLDRDLERYAALKVRFDGLTGRIARAEAREARGGGAG